MTIPDRSFSSFSGNTNFGASIPQFFSWGRGTSPDQGFPPLPSFLGVIMPNYDITKVTHQLESVEIAVESKKNGSSPKSDLNSGSAWTGYIGLHLTKNEGLLKYTAKKAVGWSNKASALRAAKVTAIAGKSLGVVGVGLTIYEDYKQNGEIGIGTGVKVAIGLAATFLGGPVIIGYAILDLTVGIATGTTLTDHIANSVEQAIKN